MIHESTDMARQAPQKRLPPKRKAKGEARRGRPARAPVAAKLQRPGAKVATAEGPELVFGQVGAVGAQLTQAVEALADA